MLIVTVGLIALLVLDIAEVNVLVADGPRQYIAYFVSEDQPVSWTKYTRGDVIVVPEEPTHSYVEDFEYKFKGWDITDDGIVDIVPRHIYFSFTAVAVYSEKYTGPFIDPRTQQE